MDKGSKVKINYKKVKENYKNNDTSNDKLTSKIILGSIEKMKSYDKIHGEIRTIVEVNCKDYSEKKNIRYELDNSFVYYANELKEVKREEIIDE